MHTSEIMLMFNNPHLTLLFSDVVQDAIVLYLFLYFADF